MAESRRHDLTLREGFEKSEKTLQQIAKEMRPGEGSYSRQYIHDIISHPEKYEITTICRLGKILGLDNDSIMDEWAEAKKKQAREKNVF